VLCDTMKGRTPFERVAYLAQREWMRASRALGHGLFRDLGRVELVVGLWPQGWLQHQATPANVASRAIKHADSVSEPQRCLVPCTFV
jgi:hypothetical protein